MVKKACVVGAGIGGIATALRLNKAGWHVTVFEANQQPGGKINEFYRDGFRFDTGPSLFTLPQMVDELFSLYETKAENVFAYHKLENITRYFFEDGTIINAKQNPGDFALEIEEQTAEPGLNVIRYLHQAKKLYALTANTFIFRPFSLSGVFKKDFVKAGINFKKLKALKTMHQVNELHFKDSRVIRIFDRYATYNGSNPYQTPGTLSVISHLEHNIGAYFPKQGMYQIVQSLVDFSKQNGIDFSLNDRVEEIITDHHRVTGLKAASGHYPCDVVISNADVFHTYDKLLKGKDIPKRLLRQQRSSSALIFYWGINDTHQHLDMHNILFSENYQKEFDHLFQLKNIYDDPTVYIFISSKVVESDAPAGKENWFVMVNAPANYQQDWEQIISKTRKHIIKKINRMLKLDIESKIEFEEILDPRKLEEKTTSFQGALYGNSSNSRYSAFQRQPNKSSIKGLYFAGGSVHPGGGIPLCLASAAITSKAILKQKQ
ncbi:MAG: 1-hydroxycarotenoid 3,4-desaturase CrtD [Bacteroidales bacterium]